MFAWMRRLPFVAPGPSGLYLHDLVRDVLVADLRWRHPPRHAELHLRARQHYLGRLQEPDPTMQTAALLDLTYLHPDLRAFLQAPADALPLRVTPLRTGEEPLLVDLVARHEGPESADIAAGWLQREPAAWLVVRGSADEVLGAVCLLKLETMGEREVAADPAVAAAFDELRNHPPLRPAETATLVRYWLSRDHYQAVSPVQALIATQLARHYLTTPALAVTMLSFANPVGWEAFCAYVDQRRAPQGDFTVGGRTYATFVHDWRTVTPSAWVKRLSLQEVGATPVPAPPVDRSGVLVLGEPEFAAAVKRALRDHSRPDRLRQNPLLRCRLVTSRAAETAPVAARVAELRRLLEEAAVDALATEPDQRLQRVLVRAYLSPAPSLERAAEVLDLPSSTFRRLLGTATGRVTAILWQRELDG
jgi:hypothetical protein